VWSPTDPAPVIRGTRAERHRERRRRGPSNAFLIILAVTALAAGLRLWHLSSPHTYVFDEVYYAKDGCYDAGYPYKQCDLESPGEQTFTVHPPLGRWLIAGGEKVFGNKPFGWRIGSAVFGTLSVLLVSLIALQLFESPGWAGVSGLLLATEGLNLVQSRVSMLDIYVTTFLLAGFLFLVLDRKWIERRTPEAAPVGSILTEELEMPPDRVPSPLWRPWRLATGVAFGAAAATKWSGFLGVLAVVVLSLVWERGRRKRARIARPLWGAIRDETFGILVFLLLVPMAVYLASYARWFVDNGVDLAAWWRVQTGMLNYSIHLRATHPYASSARWWLFLTRPVSYYYECTGHVGGACTGSAEILALGNPVIFWGTFITIPIVTILGILRRDWVAGFIATAFFIQYLPWLAVARTSFLFYMTPLTPFMVLALVYCLRSLATATETEQGGVTFGRVVAFGVVLLSVGLFVFFWPVLIGEHISQAAWSMRIWFCKGGGHCLFNWV
jgi:dolichyl-phosphate-mannose-protein mannosyltransferase